MEGSLGVLAAVTAACGACLFEAGDKELSADIHAYELKAHVFRLASPEFMGRSGAGAARAARDIVALFKDISLEPAFGKSYYQDIPSLLYEGTDKATTLGRNVAGLIRGTDPKLADEWVIVSAHYDHIGRPGGVLHPGADDNASGVAMLLEVAEHFALCGKKPRRTMCFVAFDREESGLLGSTHFATRPPLPLTKLKAFLTADMLGRSMANVMDEYLFCLGSEHSPRLRQLIEEVRPPKGLTIGRLGADLVGTRSDYGPFRDRDIPFLFFSTGQHPDYHRSTDLPERIDYQKLLWASLWIRDLARRLADDDESPQWVAKELPPDLDEIRTVAVLVSRVLDRPAIYPLSAKDRTLVEGVSKRLRSILDRGKVASADRTWLLWTARFLLATVF